MSGHSDHSAETTQAERDLEQKRNYERVDALAKAQGIDATQFAIPMIKFIRDAYQIGLKEARDAHMALRDLSAPGSVTITDTDRLLVNAGQYRRAVEAQHKAGDVARAAERCKSCGAYLDRERQSLGFCNTYCFENAQDVVEREVRIAELDRQIALVRDDLTALESERADLRSRHNPEGNEDEIDLDSDYQPF